MNPSANSTTSPQTLDLLTQSLSLACDMPPADIDTSEHLQLREFLLNRCGGPDCLSDTQVDGQTCSKFGYTLTYEVNGMVSFCRLEIYNSKLHYRISERKSSSSLNLGFNKIGREEKALKTNTTLF